MALIQCHLCPSKFASETNLAVHRRRRHGYNGAGEAPEAQQARTPLPTSGSLGFRPDELGTLRSLVIRESRRLGYGRVFHEDNRNEWPRSLRRLELIARKLRRSALNETS